VDLECVVETDPNRRELIVDEIERDAAHALELRLIDRLVEIRIDRRLRNTKMIGAAKLCLWNAGLYLFFRHSETKAEQLGRGGQVTDFLRALRRHRMAQQEE